MRPYRKERIASVVQQIVGEALLHRLSDPRVAPLTTVTRVEMTGDLLIANAYLSVPGDDATERRTLIAVRHAAGYIQRMVAQALPLRQCPELRFEIDRGAKGARRTLELLAENRQKDPERFDAADDGADEAPQTRYADETEEEAPGAPGKVTE